MTNNTITVMKKELARFFGDRRLVITTLLLPGIMIYVVYSFLGRPLSYQRTFSVWWRRSATGWELLLTVVWQPVRTCGRFAVIRAWRIAFLKSMKR